MLKITVPKNKIFNRNRAQLNCKNIKNFMSSNLNNFLLNQINLKIAINLIASIFLLLNLMKKDISKAIKNSFRSKFQKFKSKIKVNKPLENMQ